MLGSALAAQHPDIGDRRAEKMAVSRMTKQDLDEQRFPDTNCVDLNPDTVTADKAFAKNMNRLQSLKALPGDASANQIGEHRDVARAAGIRLTIQDITEHAKGPKYDPAGEDLSLGRKLLKDLELPREERTLLTTANPQEWTALLRREVNVPPVPRFTATALDTNALGSTHSAEHTYIKQPNINDEPDVPEQTAPTTDLKSTPPANDLAANGKEKIDGRPPIVGDAPLGAPLPKPSVALLRAKFELLNAVPPRSNAKPPEMSAQNGVPRRSR